MDWFLYDNGLRQERVNGHMSQIELTWSTFVFLDTI